MAKRYTADTVNALKGTAPVPVLKFPAGEATDVVAVEEPLEIRVAGEPLLVTMRTPGDDFSLALGLLFSEGFIRGVADIGTVSHCGRMGDEGYGNAVEVTPAGGAQWHFERTPLAKRGTLATAACGVCGRASIDDLLKLCGEVAPGPTVKPSLISSAPKLLRSAQSNFAQTGGVHAAMVLSADGRQLAFAEDVGRHNAVDKTIGALLRAGVLPAPNAPDAPAMLVVSGRTSFEIIQKAAVAKLRIVVGISAATSLAIETAQRVGITLVTFVRDERFNVCSRRERVAL
ncbi:MAG: formate dehydrogenase accessory sulfurtransferase FdhD [Myxococcaceae bacterium]|nr:formate dehydrogenase accessory sulfurtransferase FdhD [Myxococcaceae bacterium]